MYPFQRFPLILGAIVSLSACGIFTGMYTRVTVCDYDQAWEAALDAVKDRAVNTQDKETGLISTDWLEIPMPGRAYGAFRRDLAENSKDRSRVMLRVTRHEAGSQIGFIEERQMWTFRGGSRLFGWAPTDPSKEVLRDLETRLSLNLKERGCSLTSH